ncbi:hypothetical protein MUY14_29955 [Amycolatopsis sp. FBCC-B4732]|uniref:hypothetical protein n=1 Tax=Amycolatopsis sp. FBCC-B4732 TaxID=3079339 RepID=UPI001FF4C391|nr:hypothetical protein [Amycolatopsis sp. FBCC-B4732]UOX85982.1 hypothetical protein MUY14_29955 [Amycolatopsis sp. FBCC-B4732]
MTGVTGWVWCGEPGRIRTSAAEPARHRDLAGTLTAGEVNGSFTTPAAAADLAFDVTRAGG